MVRSVLAIHISTPFFLRYLIAASLDLDLFGLDAITDMRVFPR
jgi:hypothetical protein